jgi:thiamine-phosphate pyrophosphorylase
MVLTDRTLLTPNWTLAQAIAPAVTGGANFVLFGETDLPSTPRTSVFEFVKDGVRGRVPLVVQGDPDWAMKVGANGVHLEGDGPTAEEARSVVGADKSIGVTITTLDQAAALGAANYALIYVDWSEPDRALEVVKRYAAASPVPLIVGPDIPLEHSQPCLLAGAAGIGVTTAPMSDYDRTGSLRRYAEALGLI